MFSVHCCEFPSQSEHADELTCGVRLRFESGEGRGGEGTGPRRQLRADSLKWGETSMEAFVISLSFGETGAPTQVQESQVRLSDIIMNVRLVWNDVPLDLFS